MTNLPDNHRLLTWNSLSEHEKQNGGYWYYGHFGPTFIQVLPPLDRDLINLCKDLDLYTVFYYYQWIECALKIKKLDYTDKDINQLLRKLASNHLSPEMCFDVARGIKSNTRGINTDDV